MAAITITPGSVVVATATVVNREYYSGATITAGQCVYLDSNNAWQKMQCDGTAAEAGSGGTFGIALCGASSGQPLDVLTSGTVTIGGTVVTGTPYCVGTTAGEIVPFADLASTNKVTYLGFASTTAILDLSIKKYTAVSIA